MKNNKYVFFLAVVFILTLNFSQHILSTLSLFEYFDEDFPSERFVISRLIYNEDNAINDKGGLLLKHENIDQLYMSIDPEDYAAFKKEITEQDIKKNIYPSHSGLQDDLLNPVWQGLAAIRDLVIDKAREGSRWHKRMLSYDIFYFKNITQTIVALINATVIGLFFFWVTREYSIKHGWITFALTILFASILSFYGRSMWWMMWSWFLPFIISSLSLSFLSTEKRPPSFWITALIGVAVGLAIALKAMMGYEFLSTIMVAALIPFAYYAIKHQWGWMPWVFRSTIVSVLCVGGALLALWNHYETLQNYGFDDPVKVITQRFEMRAHGGETLNEKNHVIAESTRIPTLQVIGTYLINPRGYGLPQILLMMPLCVWLFRRRKDIKNLDRDDTALLVSIGLGFIGAISMLVILKGHAYIHGFDVVVWALPMNLLMFLFYAKNFCHQTKVS